MIKAKIRKTGETVIIVGGDDNNRSIYITPLDQTPRIIDNSDLILLDEEQRRYELAKAAMQGILSNLGVSIQNNVLGKNMTDLVIDCSIECADKMIEKLKFN